jgi:hypothetical protein
MVDGRQQQTASPELILRKWDSDVLIEQVTTGRDVPQFVVLIT